MKSSAAVLWEERTPWSIEETEIDDPRPGEVLIKLASSGLCHSDDHLRTGDLPIALPIIGGHEGAGVVEAVGPDVTRLQVGDHVLMAFLPSCGYCRWCADGLRQLCDYGMFMGDPWPISDRKPRVWARGEGLRQNAMLGTFAPYSVVHQDSCVKIDDDIPLEVASLIGCGVTTGYGAAVHRAQVKPGDVVVVVGTGGVGTSAVQGARIAGAEAIFAVDPIEFRRESARAFGATHTAESMDAVFEPLQELTRGVMADKVICTVSVMTGDMLAPIMGLTRKGGRACLTAVANVNTTKVDLVLVDLVLSQKEIVGNVFGGANAPSDFRTLLRLYRTGQLKLDEMITKTYPLEDINTGYDDLLAGRTLRGMITFD